VDDKERRKLEAQLLEQILRATQAQKEKDVSNEKKKEPEFKNVSVMYVDDPKAKHIVLPMQDGQPMSYAKAREWLTKVEQEESRKFAFSYKFRGWYPFDAMWALYRALAEVYGFTHVADFEINTFFGKMKQPPSSISIDIAPGEKQQIPWGPVEVHGLSVPLVPSIEFYQGLPILSVSAEIMNKERGTCDRMMAKAEQLLKESSIYRGKAVEIDFTIFDPRSIMFDTERAPRFMDTNIKEKDLILSEELADRLDVEVWTPIRQTDLCREHKVPLRRGVLLAGKYGVGKTLAAKVTAKVCVDNGWTFLYVKDLNQLPAALYFAKRYEPCVIFTEDINRVTDGQRDSSMDNLFNTLDGIDRKNDEVMVIFTTNNLEDIHAGMLRPGRIDSVIVVTPPDAKAAERLIRHYGSGLVEPTADLTAVGKLLAGQIPAIIAEAVQRSKAAAIRDASKGKPLQVGARHLEVAARQLLEHAKYLEDAPPAKPDLQILGEAIGNVIAEGLSNYGRDPRENDESELDVLATHVLDEAGRPDPLPPGMNNRALASGMDDVT